MFESADLLARTRRLAKRPTQDRSMEDEDWYALLTEAQLAVVQDLANQVPECQYTTEELTTADSGVSYSFSTEPLGGFIELRAGRTGRVLLPAADWQADGDYVMGAGEGQKVVFPGGVSKSFPGGLWARYVKMPGEIDAGTEPTLLPTFVRALLPARACWLWACQPGVAADPQVFKNIENDLWLGEPDKGKLGILGTLKQQFFLSGAMALPSVGGTSWWRFIDTGDGYVPVRHD